MLLRAQGGCQPPIAGGDQHPAARPQRVDERFGVGHVPDVVQHQQADLVGQHFRQTYLATRQVKIMLWIIVERLSHQCHVTDQVRLLTKCQPDDAIREGATRLAGAGKGGCQYGFPYSTHPL